MMHSGVGVLLLGAIGGYWVLERAETHKGSLRKVGRLVGAIVIVLSLLSFVLRCDGSGAHSDWKRLCPLSGKPSAVQPQ